MKSTPDLQNEELFTRWIDGLLSPSEAEAVARELDRRPELREEFDGIRRAGELLRAHLPASLEPPSADFFTSRIMEEIERDAAPAAAARPTVKSAARGSAFLRWLSGPWFTPVATAAAAVAITLAVVNHPAASSGKNGTEVARTYAPNPKVTANAFFAADAGAVVIDLQGLDAVPDEREIRAFDIASAEPAEPGMPRTFYAAAQPDRAVAVLTSSPAGRPLVRDLR